MKKLWIGIPIIVVISLVASYAIPLSEVFKGMMAMPAVCGLLAALFQLSRDHSTHQRALQIQQEQQIFNLGATSHMANTVFDKHVEFSEKYLAEVHELMITLTRKGPTGEALKHSRNLYDLRIGYTTWITPEIDEKLAPFEKAVRQIGSDAWLVKELSGQGSEERPKAVKRMYAMLKNLLDLKEPTVKDEDATIVEVKKRVREILQVDQLVSIREYLIDRAASFQHLPEK